MATNLTTLRGTPSYVAGKFGNGLSGGVLTSGLSSPLPDAALSSTGADGGSLTSGTIEGWVYVPATLPDLKLWCGHDNWFWIGFTSLRIPTARYGNWTNEINLTGTANVSGNAWHHVALVFSEGAGSLYVDGARVATSATTYSTGTSEGGFAVGGFGGEGSFDYPSPIDEVRVSSTARYSGTTYTVPTEAFTLDADTTALYHLEDANASTLSDTTAPTWTATFTMGTPTETAVVATASALASDNVAVTGYEVSYDNTATWAAIVPSGSDFALAGSAGTTYATTKLRAKDAAGNTSTPVLSVPSYTMAASADVTAPTVGTMAASSITSSGFTLTISGAAGEVGGSGLHATPYAFTTDNGATWTAYQATAVYTASGLAASTGYSCNWRVRDAAGNVSTGTAQTVTTLAATVAAGSPTDPNILYSPGNWNVTTGAAVTVNAGAYLRFSAAATSITLNFDTTGNAAPLPRIKYRVDDAGWIKTPVATSVALTIPTTTSWDVHVVEVVVAYAEESQQRWTPPLVAHVTFTGMTLSAGGTTRPIQPRSIKGLVFGDSITEGVCDLKINDSGDGDDATVAWPYLLGEFAGAEVGVVGFGAQGWTSNGNGGVPGLTTSYANIYSGVSRSFAGLDFVAVNMGANQTPTRATVEAWITALLAATPASCKVLIMRPFGGQAAAVLSAAVAAVGNARVSYVDTTGWWKSADASDSLHPYGYASVESLAPRLAAAVRTSVGGGTPTRFYCASNGTATPVVTA